MSSLISIYCHLCRRFLLFEKELKEWAIGHRFGGRSWVLIPVDLMQRKNVTFGPEIAGRRTKTKAKLKQYILCIWTEMNLQNNCSTSFQKQTQLSVRTFRSKFDFYIDKLSCAIIFLSRINY